MPKGPCIVMALSRFIIDLASQRMLNPLWISALSVIANRAAANSDYCNLAAGLFAGIVPAREFLALPVFWGTTKSAVMTLGTAAIEMLRRARRPRKSRAKFTNTIISMFKDSIGHPLGTMKWGRDCALSAFELAMQMAISAVD
jgi:hypothetical protein